MAAALRQPVRPGSPQFGWGYVRGPRAEQHGGCHDVAHRQRKTALARPGLSKSLRPGQDWRWISSASYFRFPWCSFRSRTPGPPPFSPMNSTPAAS